MDAHRPRDIRSANTVIRLRLCGIAARIFRVMSSGRHTFALRGEIGDSRWRMIGSATAATSSQLDINLPLQNGMRLCRHDEVQVARGPAPHVSHFLQKSSACGVFGRVAPTIFCA